MRHFGCGAEPINPDDHARVPRDLLEGGPEAHACCCPATAWPRRRWPSASSASRRRCPPTSSTPTRYQEKHHAEPAHVDQLKGGKAQEFVCCGRAFPGHEVGVFDDVRQAPVATAASASSGCAGRPSPRATSRTPRPRSAPSATAGCKTGDLRLPRQRQRLHHGSQEGHHHHQRAQLRPAAHGVAGRRAARGAQGQHGGLLPPRRRQRGAGHRPRVAHAEPATR